MFTQDMLQYISTSKPAHNFQEHWRPIYHLCHPCSVQYDYIGRFDALLADSQHILTRLLQARSGARPQFPPVIKSNTPNLVREYLQAVPPDIVDRVREVYGLDYEMFQYKSYENT